MIEVNVEHLGEVQFEIEARGNKVISDQPADAGGYNEGMTPPELLLAALGSCAGYYAADYLRRQKLATAGVRVKVTAEKEKGPWRLDHFRIEVLSPVALDPAQQAGLEKAVSQCIVHNTLTHPPQIETVIGVTGMQNI